MMSQSHLLAPASHPLYLSGSVVSLQENRAPGTICRPVFMIRIRITHVTTVRSSAALFMCGRGWFLRRGRIDLIITRTPSRFVRANRQRPRKILPAGDYK